MLQDFLTPLSSHFNSYFAKENGKIGDLLQAFTENNFPDINQAGIFIIGVPEERKTIDNKGVGLAPDAIRQTFYKLFPGDWDLNIVDLGNLRIGKTTDDTYQNLVSLLTLLPIDVSVIILGGSQDLTYGLINYYDINNKVYNLNVIDALIDGSLTDFGVDNENYLTEILWKDNSHLQNLSLLGIQSYLNHPKIFKKFQQLYVDFYNLGELKKDINDAEPELREAHIVSVDIRSMQYANMPAQKQGMPNGFDGIEICKLARLSGLSPKNKFFGIFEYNPLLDQRTTGANLIAQILWYYVEGKNKMQKEYPEIPKSDLLKFYVENDVVNLVFYKNPLSGRWWIEISHSDGDSSLIPCSENDYKNAIKSVITKRIYRIINKMAI